MYYHQCHVILTTAFAWVGTIVTHRIGGKQCLRRVMQLEIGLGFETDSDSLKKDVHNHYIVFGREL